MNSGSRASLDHLHIYIHILSIGMHEGSHEKISREMYANVKNLCNTAYSNAHCKIKLVKTQRDIILPVENRWNWNCNLGRSRARTKKSHIALRLYNFLELPFHRWKY